MRKTLLKLGSAITITTMLVTSITGCSTATNPSTGDAITNVMAKEVTDTTDIDLGNVFNNYTGVDKKEEMVFVFTDAKGNQNKLIVNEKLTNGTNEKEIIDSTNLKDIINLTGDETVTYDEAGNMVWNANGNSITYRGSYEEAVPVSLKITYSLDGDEIEPSELAGKSGHVVIRVDYENAMTKTVTVNGMEKEICLPFTVVTGVKLPTDVFSNVTITNGKLVDVREDVFALGYGMPGLADCLKFTFGEEDFEVDVPDYFEISADVVDFKLDSMLSVATASFLSDINLDELSSDKIKEKVDQITDAALQIKDGTDALSDGTNKVMEGTEQLKDGIKELDSKVPELKDGVNQLNDGAGALVDGANQLAGGANQIANGATQIANGASSLSDGVNAYTGGVDTLAAGAANLHSNMSTYASSMETFYNALANSDTPFDASVLALMNGANQINAGSENFKAQLEGGMTTANAQYTQAYNGFYQIAFAITTAQTGADAATVAAALSANGITSEADVTNQMQMAIATGYLLENFQTIKNAGIADVNTITTIVSGLSQAYQAYSISSSSYNSLVQSGYFDGISAVAGGLNTLNQKVGSFSNPVEGTICGSIVALTNASTMLRDQGTAAIYAGATQLSGKSEELRNGANTLKNGAHTLNSGAASLSSGANSLTNGLYALKDGTSKLLDGVNALSDGTAKLLDGVIELYNGTVDLNDGAIELADGVTRFNKEAIDKIASLADEDANTVIDTVRAIAEYGKEFTSFAGKTDDMDGTVVFIYQTEGIN